MYRQYKNIYILGGIIENDINFDGGRSIDNFLGNKKRPRILIQFYFTRFFFFGTIFEVTTDVCPISKVALFI